MRLGRWKLFAAGMAALLCLMGAAPSARAQGTVTGRVTASGTNEPLSGTRVMLVGTSLATQTSADGRYTLRNVPAGNVEVRVIRVGYTEMKKPVTVTAGETATLDFAMNQAVVQLSEMVTTATGQQRRVEIGNSVSTLGDVGQKVETTPVNNLADLMVAKSPGVVVLPGAMTGSTPVVRIRGIGSLATAGSGISNDPIYVIDGVRMNTQNYSFGFTGTHGSLLNDLDPNEIEDVEIVKGPSAATLYGTDAANGVIVITTKRGRAGATRWTWFGEAGNVDDRNTYPTTYASWGHNPTSGKIQRCTLVSQALGSCVLDSLTSFSVLMNPATTSIAMGNRNEYGMQASGGSDLVRFFISGDMQNEIGPVKMPKWAQATLTDSMGVPLRDEWVHPEAFQSYGVRTNLNASLSPKLDLTMTAGFTNTNQRIPQVDNNIFSFIYSAMNNPGFNHAGVPGMTYSEYGTLGEWRNGYGGYSPAQIFQVNNQNGTQRLIGSADAQWRPFSWMTNQGTMGVDLADNVYTSICRYAECPNSGTRRQGVISQQQNNYRNFSAKLVSNNTWQARSNLLMTTTVGADYTNQENDGVSATGQNLPPGAQTVGAAAVQSASNTLQTVNKTLGIYVQEEAAFRDRMFLTVAARTDQNSSFGEKFQSIVYPKASLSWVISDESFFPKYHWLNQFRLRSAYGASGVSPGGTVALRTFAAQTGNIAVVSGAAGGTDTPGLIANALGNPNLKPERSAEFEGGFEANVFDRAHLSFTYYDKKTHDALISQQIASSSGASALSVLKNLASVDNSGLEAEIDGTLVDRRMISWDVTVSASHNTNKILSLGKDPSGKANATIGTGAFRDSVGLPVNAAFARPYTYSDADNNGIITPNEVTVQSGYVYAGYSAPRDIFSVTNGFDLFDRKLRITVLTDYKGGYVLYNNNFAFYAQNFASWYSNNVKTTPLWDQARAVAYSSAKNPTNSYYGYLENGQFWKLREVSAALTLPNVVASKIRAKDAQLVFSARNLHTWTPYTGIDPESNYSTGDVQTDFSTIAPPTYFILRLNLHY
ncbi:MAG TPA: SusC/RagA family TonB-linked outer membrane protein [Gemmatimonadaceae bacterium]|nr:SusC/RagA family TonB-linked outer membrane protein [Gemmatimonadaceae bacterium]